MLPTIVNNDFLEGEAVPGLGHYPRFLTDAECAELVADLTALPKPPARVNFGAYHLLLSLEWTEKLDAVRAKIDALQVLSGPIDRIQVNHYGLHRGIDDHVDNPTVADGASITLGSSAVMHFKQKDDAPITTKLLLSPGDLCVVSREARQYVHGIADGVEDFFKGDVLPRIGLRIAVLFAKRDRSQE